MATIEPTQIALAGGTEIVLRSGTDSDAPQLLELVARVLRDGAGMTASPGEIALTEEQERAWIAGLRDHPNQVLLVAERDGALVGNLDFHINPRKRLAHGGVFGMSVHPDWRGRGIGRALLGRFVDWVETNPAIEKVGLMVLANNEGAIRLYERFGFTREGRRRDEVKLDDGTYVDDIVMCRFFGRRGRAVSGGAADVALRPMQRHELAAFRDAFVVDWAADLARVEGISIEAARAEAARRTDRDLDGALDAAEHALFVITAGGDDVGTLWFSARDGRAFLDDITIAEVHRGNGYGRRALELMHAELRERGVSLVQLNVYAHNPRARRLYESMGYVATGVKMTRRIET